MLTQDRSLRTGFQLNPWWLPMSIAQQIRVGLLGCILLSVFSTAAILIYLSSQFQTRQLAATQAERSRAAALEIDAYVDDLQRKLNYLARVRGLTDLQPDVQRSLLNALIRHNDAYEAVALASAQGSVIASATTYGSRIPAAVAETPEFRRAFTSGVDFNSPVRLDPATNLPVMTMSVPVRDRQDQVAGVLLARVNLKFLWFVVTQTRIGETGYVYIVDHRNIVIAEQGSSPNAFTLRRLASRPFITSDDGASTTATTYVGLRGAEVIGRAVHMPNANWTVVAELPLVEANAPVRQLLFVLGAALVVAAVLAATAGFLYSRQLVSPLQQLTHAAHRMRMGDLSASVAIRRRDEFGMLANAFNEMSAQLRSAFNELQAERNFVSTILDIAGALIVVQDAHGRVVRINRFGLEAAGFELDMVRGQFVWDLMISSEAAETAKAVFAQARDAVDPISAEYPWRGQDGHLRVIAWSHTAIRTSTGHPEFVVSVGIDITERKRAEAQLTALASSLQQSNKELEQFAYVASHDLQEPLRMITSYVQLLARRYTGRLDDKADRYITYAVDGAARMQTLINDVLAYSRIGQQETEPALTSAVVALERARANLRLSIHETHATITYDPLPDVYMNASQLVQLLQNLIANAIKFRSDAPPEIHVSARRQDDSWQFSVRDNGIGIAPQYRERIFAMFQRLHTREEYPGTGIGLAICKKIVEHHGGWISVESTPGQGATFCFTIPIEPRRLS